MIKILSIDLAHSKPIAWAFLEGERLLQYGSSKKHGNAGLRELLNQVESAESFMPELIVTEKPYLKMNPKTFRQLVVLVENLRLFSEVNEIRFVEVMPAHWKKAYLTGSGFKAASKEANVLLNHIARNMSGAKDFTPDERDAILFGLYIARRQHK